MEASPERVYYSPSNSCQENKNISTYRIQLEHFTEVKQMY